MINVTKLTDYFLIYLLVGMSGIPFFYKSGLPLLIPAVGFAFCVYIYRKKELDKIFLLFIFAMVLVLMGQMVKFMFFPFGTYLGIILRMAFPYFVLRAVGPKFFEYFVNIIVVSTLIAFFFYFISYIPGIESMLATKVAPFLDSPFRDQDALYEYWPSLIVYTINTAGGFADIPRNSGPFWEPGAYGGFIIIALIFNVIIHRTFLNRNGKILILGLITTLSTTAYVALMAIIFFYILVNAKLVYKIIFIPLILVGSIVAFTSLEFLGEKITQHADVKGNTYNTRFTSAVLDLTDTMENPLLGLGRNIKTRFKGSQDSHANHRNNGTSDFLVNFGIPFFLLYFGLIYWSFKRLCDHYQLNNTFAWYAVIMLLIIGFSEMYFTFPFFFGLAIMGILVEPDTSKKLNKGRVIFATNQKLVN